MSDIETSAEVTAPKTRKPRTERVEKVEGVALVKMTRDASYPAPHSADVHPDEVANYALGGWRKA